MKVAAVADLHVSRTSHGQFSRLFRQAADQADALALCGDLTDYGLPEEAELLVEELSSVGNTPVVAVLGNHDFESGRQEEVHRILSEAGVLVLDGDAIEIDGVGFAGAKGFAGGFGPGTLAPWGEPMIKAFVQEGLNEAMKLESALGRLQTERKIALLHYSPVESTVRGEPEAIFPFLGSSRLEEPLSRYPVDLVFHGHAHRGSPKGVTRDGVPVYNVSYPLRRTADPDRPWKIVEL